MKVSLQRRLLILFDLCCDLTTNVTYSWNTVASVVMSTVQAQLVSYPNYSIVTTGHSLGGKFYFGTHFRMLLLSLGALASLAAITLNAKIPNV
jgi:putative lipase involved disintegration of autophagic bodies